ncbi:MAG: carboxypeptidase-like regulatory domain-containing protein [Bacteroidetes bacterium]|nr:carboxypeptidase-like regulatory domain-containing protein [Bacteroidota bacterium]
MISLLALTLSWNMPAQIRGRISEVGNSKDTSALPGAVVHWLNTPIATSTDSAGYFTLQTTPLTRQLVIQALGYTADTLEVKDTTRLIHLTFKSGVELNEVDVVYESTGSELSYLNPMKIETLNERSLAKAACCNLSESFETNPSIDVNFADAVSGTKQIQMLGLSGQYAQITKENMPYMRGLANGYGLTFIPGTWIQSIQLSKGAGSVVNGYESFTGQINTELQNPETSDRLFVNMYLNQNLRHETNVNIKHRFNEHFSAGLLVHRSNNHMAQDQNHDSFTDIPTGTQTNIMNKYSLRGYKGFEAQFGWGYLNDTRYGGQNAKWIDTTSTKTPLYVTEVHNQKWEVYSKTGYIFKNKPLTSMGLQLSYLNHDEKNTYGLNRYNASQATAYANFIYQSIIKTSDHTYKLGASYMDDALRETFNVMAFSRHEQVGGVFAEYAYNFKDRFNAVAGLRADQHNYYGLFFTPRLHLRYAMNKGNTVLRASGGRALRTANVFADNLSLMASSRQWIIQTSDLGLPYGLKPETGWNYGLNFTQKMKLNYRDAFITIDLYRTDFTNQVIIDMDQNTQQVAIYNLNGPSFSNTAQIEFGWEIRKRLNVRTAYRYVDAEVHYQSGLRERPYVSKHRAFINLAYETKNRHWQFDATTQWNGSKRLPYTQSNPDTYQRADYSPAYFNVLGQITYLTKMLNGDFHVFAGVENALNYKQPNPIVASDAPYSKYFDASMVWGPIYGRMLYVGLRYKLK